MDTIVGIIIAIAYIYGLFQTVTGNKEESDVENVE